MSDPIYNGLSSFGYAQSLFGLLFIFVLSSGLIALMIYLIKNPSNLSATADATVTSVTTNKSNNTVTGYTSSYSFSVGENKYSGSVTDKNYRVIGDIIKIHYDPKNPVSNDGSMITSTKQVVMIISFVIVLILVGGISNFYLTSTYKPYAAMTGLRTII